MRRNTALTRIMASGVAAIMLCAGGTFTVNAAEEEPVKADVSVKAIQGLSDDFIGGMDVSSMLSLEESGVTFKNANGEIEDLFTLLKESGVNYVRLRVWNDPFTADGQGYGGGNVNADRALTMAKRATAAGLKVLVDFHYSDFWADPSKQQVPKAVVLDGPPSCQQELEEYLCQKAQRSVQLLLPQKGDQMKLLQMAKENASQQIAEQTRRTSREISALDELARLLGLHQVPNYIEAYDISNIGSETIVAGMVVFEGGRPLKGAYRKFSVRSVVGKPDDYASMREVLTRRLERYEQHKQEGVGFGRLPDLILLDGGRGHVAAVKPLVRQMGFDIPIFGMAKDDRHRTRTIATEDGELSVSSFRAAFDLLTSIQDEVHRFSIGYSRSKHASRAMESVLRSVEGIGEKRAKNLFLRFRTLKAMEAATVEQLEETPGMTHLTALNLYRYLHENDGQ